MTIESRYTVSKGYQDFVPVADIRRALAQYITNLRRYARGLPRPGQVMAGEDIDLLHEFVENLGVV